MRWVTLVKTKPDCLKKNKTTTRLISELVRQRVPNRRTGDRDMLTKPSPPQNKTLG